MVKVSRARCISQRSGAARRLRAFAENGNFLSGMVSDRSKDGSGPAKLEGCDARAAGPVSYCDARKPISQSPSCEREFFTGPVHWQYHQRRIDDVADNAVVHQGAKLVALPRGRCAKKRALERHTPYLSALCVIGRYLLEICVI